MDRRMMDDTDNIDMFMVYGFYGSTFLQSGIYQKRCFFI